MSSELFGTAGGTRLYAKDQADLQHLAAQTELTRQRTKNEAADAELNPLKADLLRAQIGHQGASTTHQGTLADLNRVQADAILRKADKEDRVAAAIAESVGGKSLVSEDGAEASGITDLAALGQKVMAAGDLEKGEKLIKMAADLKKSEAATRASAASELVRNTNAQIKKLEFMQQVFSGVTDPASHARALLLLQGNELTAGETVPKGLQTFDPKMISQFLAGSKVQLNKKRVEIAGFNAASADQARTAAQETREFLAGLAERRTKAVEERVANLTKTGDEKTVPLPNSAELRLMRAELAEEGIEFDEEDGEALMELAEQAKILTTRNPSISRKEAITRVSSEAQKRGDLVPGKSSIIPFVSSKAKHKQTEGSLAMPLPLPTSRADLVPGNYYRGPDGRVEKWNGTAGEPVAKRVPKPKVGG